MRDMREYAVVSIRKSTAACPSSLSACAYVASRLLKGSVEREKTSFFVRLWT